MPPKPKAKPRRSRPRNKKNKAEKPPSQPVHMSGTSVIATVDSFIPVFPNMATRRLRYSAGNVITSPSGVLTAHIFTLSGLYDPDITGTGHQPLGFDDMMRFYEHYHVLHCKARVTFMNKQPLYRGFVALKVAPDTSLSFDYEVLVEEGRASVDFISGDSSTFNGTKLLTAEVNVPAVNGLTRQNFLADPDLRGTISSNPSEQTYLHVCAWSPAGQNLDVEFNAVLEFTAVFTEPRNLTKSLKLPTILTTPPSSLSPEWIDEAGGVIGTPKPSVLPWPAQELKTDHPYGPPPLNRGVRPTRGTGYPART